MPMPPSVTKVTKDGVTFISNVDQAQYLLSELIRAANRDVGKYVRSIVVKEIRQRRGLRKSKRPYRAIQYWSRKRELDLQIGFGNTKQGMTGDTWYAIQQELGTQNQPKHAILTNAVHDNIPMIREIQGQYLSAIADKNRALALVDESEAIGNEPI